MVSVIEFFFGIMAQCYEVLNRIRFEMFGVTVTWVHLLLSFAFLSIIISVFWKGAHK